MPRAVACYREFAPCEALREHVRAFFSFAPRAGTNPAHLRITREVEFADEDNFCSPLFADGHTSMVFSFARVCGADGQWRRCSARPNAIVIGAMSRVGPTFCEERAEMVGVYFQPGRVFPFTHVPSGELTDQIVALDDLWGVAGSQFAGELNEANGEARIDRLESVLLGRLGEKQSPTALNAPGLAVWALRRGGRLTVQRLADAAGVSRQHLTRVFRECVGVPPKLYCRLARFQSGLAYAGRGKNVDWARVALEMGYSDQSHMIAEFREFSSLTPQALATQKWFHPFIERARDSRPARA